MWDDDFQSYVKREADRIANEIYDPPEYFPPEWNARNESTDQLFQQYKEEYEKLKMYASFDRTLAEIESLEETTTDYGD